MAHGTTMGFVVKVPHGHEHTINQVMDPWPMAAVDPRFIFSFSLAGLEIWGRPPI